MHVTVRNVYSVFILESCICAFPRRDSTAAISELDVTTLHPGRAKTIEKVGLTGYRAAREIRGADFANVDLKDDHKCLAKTLIRKKERL